MTRWLRAGATVIGGVAATAVVGAVVGRARWERDTARVVSRVVARRDDGRASARFSPEMLDGLPAPVRRYLAFALSPGQRMVRAARIEQRGEFAAAPNEWRPFTAVEHFAPDPPRFVWNAEIRLAPLVAVRVRDSYVDGVGAMQGRLIGLLPVVDQHGTRAMAVASLQRYLAESPWVPTALLPGDGVRWTAVDDSTARATLTDGDVAAVVDFRFAPGGEITGISAQRYRDVKGTPVLTPWVGRFADYERVDGMMVPRSGEIAWVLPEGRAPYWRGRSMALQFEFAR